MLIPKSIQLKLFHKQLRITARFFPKFLESVGTSCLSCFKLRRTLRIDLLPIEAGNDFTKVYAFIDEAHGSII